MANQELANLKRKIRIRQPNDVRRLLQEWINIIRSTDDEEISKFNKAKLINQLSATMLKCMEVGELKERLEKLEEEIYSHEETRRLRA